MDCELKITYTANGASLSRDGHVTHMMLRPGFGISDSWSMFWALYKVTGPYTRKLVGHFETAEKAANHARRT